MITIGSHSLTPKSNYPGSTCTLRIYSSIQFVADDGTVVMPGTPESGNFFKSVDCTISAGVITIPAFDLPPSTGLDIQTAKYTAVFFDSKGIKRDTFVEFRLPSSFGASTTWSAILIYKHGSQPLRDASVYTKGQTDAQIALAAGNLNRAAQGTLGRIETATAPLDPLHPKAVETGDPRVTADQPASVASIRTLGTGALDAAAGNDARLSDNRAPLADAPLLMTVPYSGNGALAVGKPVKMSGANAVTTTTTDTSGVIGIVAAGITNQVTVAVGGPISSSFFDTEMTGYEGYYVVVSPTVNGQLHVVASYPATGQVIGRVRSVVNGEAAGLVDVFGSEVRGGSSSSLALDITGYGAVSDGTTDNTTALTNAQNAAIALGAGLLIPVGSFKTNSISLTVPLRFASGASILKPATGQTITITKDVSADTSQHFSNATSGLGTISFTGNKTGVKPDPRWWGAVVDGSTSDQAAWDAAIAAAVTMKVATIVAPKGISIVASLVLPYVTDSLGDFYSITIEGVGQPSISYGTVASTGVACQNCSIIKSTTAGTAGVITSASYGSFTGLELTLRNVVIRREDNPTGPGIDAGYLSGFHLDNASADAGGKFTTFCTQPTHAAAYGVITPVVQNAANLDIRGNTFITGFYTGLQANEHLQQDGNLTISACAVAFEIPANNHAVRLARLSCYNNTVNIKGVGGASYLEITQFDMEHANGGGVPAWQETTTDISDASNYIHGKISGWHVVKAFVGVDNTLTQTGAFYFMTPQLSLQGYKDIIVNNSTNVSIADSAPDAAVTMTFDTVLDNHSNATLSGNAIRPTKYGSVSVMANIRFAANATGVRAASIWKHSGALGSNFKQAECVVPSAGGTYPTVVNVSSPAITISDPGDYLFIEVAQNSGGALNVLLTTGADSSSPLFIMRQY